MTDEQEIDGLDDVVNRLRDSRAKHSIPVHSDDYVKGMEWAKSSAEYHELQALAALADRPDWADFLADKSSSESLPDRLTRLLMPQVKIDKPYILMFGIDAPTEYYTPKIVDDFVKGALAVWSQAKDRASS